MKNIVDSHGPVLSPKEGWYKRDSRWYTIVSAFFGNLGALVAAIWWKLKYGKDGDNHTVEFKRDNYKPYKINDLTEYNNSHTYDCISVGVDELPEDSITIPLKIEGTAWYVVYDPDQDQYLNHNIRNGHHWVDIPSFMYRDSGIVDEALDFKPPFNEEGYNTEHLMLIPIKYIRERLISYKGRQNEPTKCRGAATAMGLDFLHSIPLSCLKDG